MSDTGKDRRADERELQGARLERLVRARWHGPRGIAGLSERVGVTRATIYSWFRGATRPDAAALARLAQVLEASPSEVLATFAAEEPADQSALRTGPMPLTLSKAMLLPAALRSMRDAPFEADLMEGVSFLARSVGPDRDSDPPIIEAIGRMDVVACEGDDQIGDVARLLYESDFSQLPVRDRRTWIGLITGETIARWLAARAGRGLGFDERTPVREVLPYAEDPTVFRVVAADAPVSAVIEQFAMAGAEGRVLMAVLITETGEPWGEALAIATRWDLPGLRGSPDLGLG